MAYLGLLVVLACSVMMGAMMWMRRGNRQPTPPAQPDGYVREEIAALRAGADPPQRSEDTPE